MTVGLSFMDPYRVIELHDKPKFYRYSLNYLQIAAILVSRPKVISFLY